MNDCIPIEKDLDKTFLKKIGGKGRGLAYLIKAGFKVPRTIYIPPEKNIEKATEEVFKYFKNKIKFVVRSSANEEDGNKKSYAGSFESYLRVSGIQNLKDAICKSRQSGIKIINRNIGVIVQEMIEADFSGVIFTCDPVSGSRNHVVLEKVSGTSEGLMEGIKNGENYIFNRFGEIIKGDRNVNNNILKDIVMESLFIEDKICIEGPLDFEWAFKDGKIYWLQVRPVTALYNSKPNDRIFYISEGQKINIRKGDIHWTSINAREAVPSVLNPLACDYMLEFIKRGFYESFNLLGVSEDILDSYNTISVFNGRPFLNITDLQNLTTHLPLKNPEVLVEKILKGNSAERPHFIFSFALLIPLLRIFYRDISLPWAYKKLVKDELEKWRYPLRDELNKLSCEELLDNIECIGDISGVFPIHMIGSMKYMNFYAFLEEICRKYNSVPSNLIQGVGTLLFASSSAALRGLAYSIRNNWTCLFNEDYSLKDKWQYILCSNSKLNSFKKEFDEFLDIYGHLGEGSVDFSMKNWREKPEIILKIVGDILKKGEIIDKKEYLKKLQEKSHKSVNLLISKMSFIDKIKLKILLKLMYDSAHYRENVKFYLLRRMAIVKCYFLELSLRFLKAGIIKDINDIFFITANEIENIVRNNSKGPIYENIKIRQQKFKKDLKNSCPLHIIEKKGGRDLYYPLMNNNKKEFRGIGASAGMVTGKARVILSLDEADSIEPGEIIVTTTTDPSWTPYFSVASGIVVEIGSMLSHGAVVAREIGLPAVLGIPGIVSAIRNGDTIQLDGLTGRVFIEIR